MNLILNWFFEMNCSKEPIRVNDSDLPSSLLRTLISIHVYQTPSNVGLIWIRVDKVNFCLHASARGAIYEWNERTKPPSNPPHVSNRALVTWLSFAVMADDYRRSVELERRIFELDNKCATLRTEKPGNWQSWLQLRNTSVSLLKKGKLIGRISPVLSSLAS